MRRIRSGGKNTLRRWLKFNLVGAIGVMVQLGALHFFTSGLGANYLLATALAVEAAVLHNFAWHERFTWADCAGSTGRGAPARLLRFNLATGAVSVAGNLALMSLLVERAHLPFLAANLAAIVICSLLNFVVSDRFVFGSRGWFRGAEWHTFRWQFWTNRDFLVPSFWFEKHLEFFVSFVSFVTFVSFFRRWEGPIYRPVGRPRG